MIIREYVGGGINWKIGIDIYMLLYVKYGLPRWLGGKESACLLPAREVEGHGSDRSVMKTPWRKKWQPTPVFLPEKSHGQRSLAGHSPWGCKEPDMTE